MPEGKRKGEGTWWVNPATVKCPHCKKGYNVDPRWKSSTCPDCKK